MFYFSPWRAVEAFWSKLSRWTDWQTHKQLKFKKKLSSAWALFLYYWLALYVFCCCCCFVWLFFPYMNEQEVKHLVQMRVRREFFFSVSCYLLPFFQGYSWGLPSVSLFPAKLLNLKPSLNFLCLFRFSFFYSWLPCLTVSLCVYQQATYKHALFEANRLTPLPRLDVIAQEEHLVFRHERSRSFLRRSRKVPNALRWFTTRIPRKCRGIYKEKVAILVMLCSSLCSPFSLLFLPDIHLPCFPRLSISAL